MTATVSRRVGVGVSIWSLVLIAVLAIGVGGTPCAGGDRDRQLAKRE